MTEPGWYQELVTTVEQTHGEQAATTTRMLIDATSSMRLRSTHQPPHTTGASFVSVIPGMLNDIELFALFSKGGRVAVQVKTLRRINPFRIAEQEQALRRRKLRSGGGQLDHKPQLFPIACIPEGSQRENTVAGERGVDGSQNRLDRGGAIFGSVSGIRSRCDGRDD